VNVVTIPSGTFLSREEMAKYQSDSPVIEHGPQPEQLEQLEQLVGESPDAADDAKQMAELENLTCKELVERARRGGILPPEFDDPALAKLLMTELGNKTYKELSELARREQAGELPLEPLAQPSERDLIMQRARAMGYVPLPPQPRQDDASLAYERLVREAAEERRAQGWAPVPPQRTQRPP
jgi:hypothetical protein